MSKIDSPFDVLGIKADATDSEVKTAYRKLVKLHHPDKGGDDAKFRQIQAAYNKAKNPKWRKQYAAIAKAAQNNQPDDNDFLSQMARNSFLNSIQGTWAQHVASGRNVGKTYAQQMYQYTAVPASALQGNSTGIGAQPSTTQSYTRVNLARPAHIIIPPNYVRNFQARAYAPSYNYSNGNPRYECTFEYVIDDGRGVPICGDEIINMDEIIRFSQGGQRLYGLQNVRATVTETRTIINNGTPICMVTCEWS